MAKLVEALAELWPGADGKAAAAANPAAEKPTPPAEAEKMAARARKKYDATLRWVLGVFSAVGLLIFGSVPFADLEHVSTKLLVLALVLAGLGLGIVIWAATTGLEMQDAGLGELSRTFKRRSPSGWRSSWLFPRAQASSGLEEVLHDPEEASAHLGPGMATTQQLIQRLGVLEQASMLASFGWSGGAVDARRNPPEEVDRNAVQHSKLVRSKMAVAAKDEQKVLESALAELRKQSDEEPGSPEVAAALDALRTKYRGLVAVLPDEPTLRSSAEAETYDELLKIYTDHRALVLDESLVAQMRGTFRVARRWLMVGAAFVLGGGTTFAYAVANPIDSDPQAKVTVTLVHDEDPWTAFEECGGAKTGEDLRLDGLLTRSDDGDGAQDGPFAFVATDGECAGKSSEVEEGQGSYAALLDPDEDDTAEDSGGDPTGPARPKKVTIRIEAFTSAWRSLDDCRGEGRRDMRRLSALLYSSDDSTDGRRDGPFDALITAGPCAGERITVADGEGSYRPR